MILTGKFHKNSKFKKKEKKTFSSLISINKITFKFDFFTGEIKKKEIVFFLDFNEAENIY